MSWQNSELAIITRQNRCHNGPKSPNYAKIPVFSAAFEAWVNMEGAFHEPRLTDKRGSIPLATTFDQTPCLIHQRLQLLVSLIERHNTVENPPSGQQVA